MIWHLIADWLVPARALDWGRLTKRDPFYLWGYPTLAEINAGLDITPNLELDR
jgi:hypothetical protein